jgi:uncharacterized protein
MKIIKSFFLVMLLFASNVMVAQPAEQPQPSLKTQEILKLMELTNAVGGFRDRSMASAGQLTSLIRSRSPHIPESALDFVPKLAGEVILENEDFLKTLFIALYDRNYTLDEVRELNIFYASPIGKKTLDLQQAFNRQILDINAQFTVKISRDLTRRIQENLATKGYKLQ